MHKVHIVSNVCNCLVDVLDFTGGVRILKAWYKRSAKAKHANEPSGLAKGENRAFEKLYRDASVENPPQVYHVL